MRCCGGKRPNNVIAPKELESKPSSATATKHTITEMSSPSSLVGGIEGGATHSTMMLFDAFTMETVATVEGPATNVFILGHEETCKRIHKERRNFLIKLILNRQPSFCPIQICGCKI
jgi:hypothetical protein